MFHHITQANIVNSITIIDLINGINAPRYCIALSINVCIIIIYVTRLDNIDKCIYDINFF